jgi:hypothetical protein
MRFIIDHQIEVERLHRSQDQIPEKNASLRATFALKKDAYSNSESGTT